MQSIYGLLKSNNEIEICEVSSDESKLALEKELHKQRISFSIRWAKPKLFCKQKELCCFAINLSAKEKVEEIINDINAKQNEEIKIVYRKHSKNFL